MRHNETKSPNLNGEGSLLEWLCLNLITYEVQNLIMNISTVRDFSEGIYERKSASGLPMDIFV